MTTTNYSRNFAQRRMTQIAIAFFLLAAILGTMMRYIYLYEIPFLEYKNVLHAHSHTAMLGWGFTVLAGAFVFILLPAKMVRKVYSIAFWGNVTAGAAMFFAFLYQGYGAVSIAFSTLHLVVAYYFAWHFLKELKTLPPTNASKFALWAVYWMLISTLGLWAIAPVSSLLGKLHPLYFASIQFFLHFQFNGWFTYGILALLFRYSEDRGRAIQLPKGTFGILQLSLLLTYTLSITWSTPEDILFYLNSMGVVLQIIAFVLLAKGFAKRVDFSIIEGRLAAWLLRLGLMSLAFKVIIQGAVALPFIAKVSYTIRNFVIGFIHLSMLGAFSLSVIALLLSRGLLPTSNSAATGYRLLALGFILTEAILFIQGILLWAEKGFLPYYHTMLLGATALLPMALFIIFYHISQEQKTSLTNTYKLGKKVRNNAILP